MIRWSSRIVLCDCGEIILRTETKTENIIIRKALVDSLIKNEDVYMRVDSIGEIEKETTVNE